MDVVILFLKFAAGVGVLALGIILFGFMVRPIKCPYCHIECEPVMPSGEMCPKCGYDTMTGKRV